MTIKDLGLGGTNSATYKSLGTLIKEFAPLKFQTQINQASELIGSGQLEEATPDGEEYIVTLDGGNKASVGWVRDKGRLPTGMSSQPVKARALPAFLVGVISLGMGAAMAQLTGPQVVKKLDEEMDATTKNLAQFLARGIHDVGVNPQAGATWTATAADGTVTVPFLDASLFRPGSAYDFIDVSSGFAYVVRCTAVTPAAIGANTEDVAANVAFINDVPNPATGNVVALTDTTVATGDSFRPRGYTAGFGAANTDAGQRCNNFDDIAGSGAVAAFMGITPGAIDDTHFPNWLGRYRNLNAAYSQEALVKFMAGVKTFSGEYPDVAVMSPMVGAAHVMATGFHGGVFGVTAAISASHPMTVDKTADKFGAIAEDSGLRVGGAKIVQDSNMPAARAIVYKKALTRLAVWKKLGPDEEAGDPILLGRTFYDKSAQLSGGYNLVSHKRCSVGCFDNITGL